MEDQGGKDKNNPVGAWRDLGRGFGEILNIGYYIAASVIIGLFMGYYLDTWLGTLPLFTLLMTFLGAAAGLREIFRASSRKAK